MNVKIGAEAALFPEKEYISGIFVTVQMGLFVPSFTPFPFVPFSLSSLFPFLSLFPNGEIKGYCESIRTSRLMERGGLTFYFHKWKNILANAA
jgi:hypothetical protein